MWKWCASGLITKYIYIYYTNIHDKYSDKHLVILFYKPHLTDICFFLPQVKGKSGKIFKGTVYPKMKCHLWKPRAQTLHDLPFKGAKDVSDLFILERQSSHHVKNAKNIQCNLLRRHCVCVLRSSHNIADMSSEQRHGSLVPTLRRRHSKFDLGFSWFLWNSRKVIWDLESWPELPEAQGWVLKHMDEVFSIMRNCQF